MPYCLCDFAKDSRLRGFSHSSWKGLQMQKGMRYPLPDKHGALEESLTASSIEESKRRSPIRKAALLPFVFVMYAYATGGPFGLEDIVTTSEPGLTLLYQVFIPLFCCIAVPLVAAQMTTAIPVVGGF